MVQIVGFKERVSHDGRPFMALVLQGGVEIIKSQNGTLYATARKCNVASTFDEETCKTLVGQELKGTIEKVDCPSYEYQHPNTGEILTLYHRYTFIPEEKEDGSPVMNHLELEDASVQNYQ